MTDLAKLVAEGMALLEAVERGDNTWSKWDAWLGAGNARALLTGGADLQADVERLTRERDEDGYKLRQERDAALDDRDAHKVRADAAEEALRQIAWMGDHPNEAQFLIRNVPRAGWKRHIDAALLGEGNTNG